MKTHTTFLAAFSASILLSACGDSDDASLDATAETVEMPADAALEGIEEQAVPDPAAALPAAVSATSNSDSAEQEQGTPVADGINQATDAIRDATN